MNSLRSIIHVQTETEVMQVELILKIVTGTNGRYYVTERGVVIHTTHDWYDAWEWLGQYESFLQDQDFSRRYPGLI